MSGMPKLTPEAARDRAERAARALAADGRVKLVFLFGSAADPGTPALDLIPGALFC